MRSRPRTIGYSNARSISPTLAIVALHELEILTQGSFEVDASQEPMKEIDSSVVRKGARAEGDPQLAGPLGIPSKAT